LRRRPDKSNRALQKQRPQKEKASRRAPQGHRKIPTLRQKRSGWGTRKSKVKSNRKAKRAAERCPIMATEQKTKCPPEGGRYKTETDSALRADGRTTVRPYKSNAKKTPERRQPDKFNRALQKQRPQKEKASRRAPQGHRKIPTLRQKRSGWGTRKSKVKSNRKAKRRRAAALQTNGKAGGVKPTLQRQRRNPHPSPKTLRMGHPQEQSQEQRHIQNPHSSPTTLRMGHPSTQKAARLNAAATKPKQTRRVAPTAGPQSGPTKATRKTHQSKGEDDSYEREAMTAAGRPASLRISSARSATSQVKPGPMRPKWPYEAVSR